MSDASVLPGEGTVVVGAAGGGGGDPPKPPPKDDQNPDWLNPRLERERSSFLKKLGVSSFEDAKKAIDAALAQEESQKSAAQKAAELENSLKQAKSEQENLTKALGAYAGAQMKTLTDAQRNAVAAVAGDDPALQLKTIEALRPTWASEAAPAAVADSAPAPAMPKDGAASAPPDPKTIFVELKKTNPVLAARYAFANGVFDQ
jgi:hypothetical protein